MPIDIGGYGADRTESILTGGKVSKWDALWLGFAFAGAFMSIFAVLGIIAGIILVLMAKRDKTKKAIGIVMIVIGIVEFIAHLFTAKYGILYTYTSGENLTGLDKFLYYTNWTSIKTYNTLLTPSTLPELQITASSFGTVPIV